MTTQLVTHVRCLDGAACGVLGLAAGLEPHFVYPDGALAYLRSLPPEQPVVLADVSVSPDGFREQAHRLTALIDHHQTALVLTGLPGVHLDVTHCAGTLLYHWLRDTGRLAPDPAWDRLLAPVEAHDLWQPDRDEGQRLNLLFHALGWEWFRDKYRAGFVPLTAAEQERLTVLREEEAAFVQRHCARAERFDAAGHPAAVVVLDSEGAVNELAHALLADGAEVAILLKPDGRLSVRATGPVDAARLMEAGFQGGGHPRAAGGRLPPGLTGPPVAWIKEQTARVMHAATDGRREGHQASEGR